MVLSEGVMVTVREIVLGLWLGGLARVCQLD